MRSSKAPYFTAKTLSTLQANTSKSHFPMSRLKSTISVENSRKTRRSRRSRRFQKRGKASTFNPARASRQNPGDGMPREQNGVRAESRALFFPCGHAFGEDQCNVDRGAARSVLDLMAARCAVRDQDRIVLRPAHGRQQRELRHLERHVDGLLLIAEGAGHAAAGGFDQIDFQARHAGENFLHRSHDVEGFLVAMAV